MLCSTRVLLLVLSLLSCFGLGRVIMDDEEGHEGGPEAGAARVSLWATRAHDWLLATVCADPEDLCRDLVGLPRAAIRVHAAGRESPEDAAEAVVATLVGPEGGRALGPHDAVIVLDPFPAASFGHLVLVFFVALRTTEERCSQLQGLRLENGDCVQPAREHRCAPGGPTLSGGGAGGGAGSQAPCQLLFLPLVTPASRPPHQHHDKLRCRTDIAGFLTANCPELRPQWQVSQMRCDPVTTNTKRCDTTQFIRTRCPFMQTCDHAVLLSGGWNRHLSGYSSLQNILDLHGMLKHVGFYEDNIKVFFANGVIPERDDDGVEPVMYPSALKLALRYHVHRVCETARCADTLLLYLNGPALPGGATLLWDADSNGQLDETEVYSARELLRDVSNCGARRVIIVADQSFSRDLVRHASQLHAASRGLRNVVVLSAPSGAPATAPWAESGLLASHWTAPHHRHACLADLVRLAPTEDKEALFLGSASLLNTTLTGQPCGQSKDQRHRYAGCQNLSTREWMAAQDGDDDQPEEDQDDDEEESKPGRSENLA